MTTLILHVATTGLWDWKADALAPHQPHMLRLAMLRRDDDGTQQEMCCLIRPPADVLIQPDAMKAHHITQAMAAAAPLDLADALETVAPMIHQAETLVAYGADFTRKIITASLARAGHFVPDDDWKKRWSCAMRGAGDVMRLSLQSQNQWKFPKLTDAYRHFEGAPLVEPKDPREAGLYLLRAVAAVHDGVRAVSKATAHA